MKSCNMSLTDGLILILIFLFSAWLFFLIVCHVQYSIYSKRNEKIREEGYDKAIRNGDLRKAVRKDRREAALRNWEEAVEKFREEVEKL